jgi:hypothetical protein
MKQKRNSTTCSKALAKDGQLDTSCIEGMFIRHLNQIQSKTVAAHAESL